MRASLLALAVGLILACDSGSRPGPTASSDSGGTGPRDGAAATDAPGGGEPVPDVLQRYIRNDRARRLVIELDRVAGQEPPTSVSDSIATDLATVLDKPDGIEVVLDGAVASRGADHAWTDEELSTLATETRSFVDPDGTVSMHAIFVDGHSARDSDSSVILGVALDLETLVIFADTVDRACSSATIGPLLRDQLCEATLRNVWLHEIGHVLGLVNRGLPMQADHEDDAHPAHDEDSECVMYWAAETGQLVDALASRLVGGDSAMLSFDPQCLADVAAVRDR
jgi:hypothetical protein